jgi:plastocyanin
MGTRAVRSLLALLALSLGLFASAIPVAQAGTAYRVQLDAMPPTGESWSFLRFFPQAISVHQGDVIEAAWGGGGGPHTATLVPSADPNAWREANQGPPGPQDPSIYPYALMVPDTAVGGDDAAEILLNPSVAGPSDPTCGTATTPCGFDGTQVVSSGFQEANPASQPSLFVQVNAPVGTYTFLCLLHPGMQETVNVVASGTQIPSPADVASRITHQVKHATNVDAENADAQAQHVNKTHLSQGHFRYTVHAGGFSNNVSANEYVDNGLKVHVGDQIHVLGNYEIHTATVPKTSVKTVPFVMPVCEVTGPDTPAGSPADCTSPDKFQLVFNPTALAPTNSNKLSNPTKFVNSGLFAYGTSYTFDAAKAGVYRLVCLVHGPMMHLTISVSK